MGGCRCPQGEPCEKCGGTSAPDIAARHPGRGGRFPVQAMVEPDNEFGRAYNRTFDVDPLTGFTFNTTPAARWTRGAVLFGPTPSLMLPPRASMFDRTDPRTWPGAYGG